MPQHSLIMLLSVSCCMVSGAEPVRVGISDLLVNPSLYNGRLVTVHAQVISGFEEFGLSGDGNTVAIWIAWPDDRNVHPSPAFRLESGRERKALSAYLREKGCYQITATFTGRFDYAGTDAPGKLAYGHLGLFKYRLVPMKLSSIMKSKCVAR